ATSHASALWERAGPLAAVDLDGTEAWALADDQRALTDQAQPGGVRLLPNLDPLNAGRDRELLVPDPALRRRIWTAIGGPGTVLVSGEVAALWRPAKKGKRVLITVEPVADLAPAAKGELAAEAERIAPFRGADRGELRLAAP
ncbi:MAG TPA: crosslink repair DNA glycosylase YcaQ family protein, partial [Thermoleophilaceae bacterium]|nr:crosslink repair DNA glycosylase YcaQ family protein [Thermoleophilaceae bacterium]